MSHLNEEGFGAKTLQGGLVFFSCVWQEYVSHERKIHIFNLNCLKKLSMLVEGESPKFTLNCSNLVGFECGSLPNVVLFCRLKPVLSIREVLEMGSSSTGRT